MKKEIWMPILGYEEFYWVSNLGRIRSLPRTIRDKKGRIIIWLRENPLL